jgi:c-di-GMP-binding flagellar brake protein YcgR
MNQKPESYDCSKDCLRIDLGCPLFLQCLGLNERVKSELVGLYPGLYLIVSTPGGKGSGGIPEETKDVIVRYIFRGEVMGFKSSIIERIERPFRLIFLSYPKAVESLNLRRSSRVPCNLPARIAFEGKELDGILTDISTGGCRFTSRAGAGKDQAGLALGAQVSLAFYLPGSEGKTIIGCLVKSTNASNERIELGLQFQVDETMKTKEIERYVKEVSLIIQE